MWNDLEKLEPPSSRLHAEKIALGVGRLLVLICDRIDLQLRWPACDACLDSEAYALDPAAAVLLCAMLLLYVWWCCCVYVHDFVYAAYVKGLWCEALGLMAMSAFWWKSIWRLLLPRRNAATERIHVSVAMSYIFALSPRPRVPASPRPRVPASHAACLTYIGSVVGCAKHYGTGQTNKALPPVPEIRSLDWSSRLLKYSLIIFHRFSTNSQIGQ